MKKQYYIMSLVILIVIIGIIIFFINRKKSDDSGVENILLTNEIQNLSNIIDENNIIQNVFSEQAESDNLDEIRNMQTQINSTANPNIYKIEEEYDVYYRVHVQNFGWLDWAKNGEIAGTVNYGYRMEAIKIALVRKDGEGLTPVGTSSKTFDTQAVYSAHVQNIGWQDEVYNGETIGTVGQGLRMEALKLDLYKPLYAGNVTYSAHIQNIGWQDWKKDGEISGTIGKKLQMEAVKIKLTGEMADHYDIYYRAQVEELGWLEWVKDGKEAGTTGKGYRLESLEIKLVPKTEG